MAVVIDIWAYDVGAQAASAKEFADGVADRARHSWETGADLALFPEFLWMGLERFVAGGGASEVARLFWEELWPMLSTALRRERKAVILGTVPWRDENGRLRNRAPILLPEGPRFQDKLHLTPWENELSPGDDLLLWSFTGLRVAVTICLDIEVPELAAALRGRGVDLLLVPSATETMLGAGRILRCASARAVELGCCVAVSPLTGATASCLVDENVGQIGFFTPSQAPFAQSERETRNALLASGIHVERFSVDAAALARARKNAEETNPSRLVRQTVPVVESR